MIGEVMRVRRVYMTGIEIRRSERRRTGRHGGRQAEGKTGR